MKNFTYSIPTTVHFGRDAVLQLGGAVRSYTDSVLLVYGGGSIKRNGVYDAVLAQLKEHGIRFAELSGVDPNPRIESVRAGIEICRREKLGGVLAVGGGSSIDCAKVIAGGVHYPGDPWELVTGQAPYPSILPIFSVLTLSATGSEMDIFAVISKMDSQDKLGTSHPDMRPKVSILDPTYTFTVPKNQTAAGTADIFSHICEGYFTVEQDAFVSDRFCEGLMKTCIHYAPVALSQPDNYEARANLMWASSNAINGMTELGKPRAWSVHPIEHQLSAVYDITHGVGLAILTPNWMTYVLNETTLPRFVTYGVNVWGMDPALPPMEIAQGAIARTREFFDSMGIPSTLGQLGIDGSHIHEMAVKARTDSFDHTFMPLSVEDIEEIYRMSL